ncbi:MAG: hypothetical protein U1E58_07880 [Tabrizicola sp.]
MTDADVETIFPLPTAPAVGPWDQLTLHGRTWIEFIRVISNGFDPRIIPDRVRALRLLLDTT